MSNCAVARAFLDSTMEVGSDGLPLGASLDLSPSGIEKQVREGGSAQLSPEGANSIHTAAPKAAAMFHRAEESILPIGVEHEPRTAAPSAPLLSQHSSTVRPGATLHATTRPRAQASISSSKMPVSARMNQGGAWQ